MNNYLENIPRPDKSDKMSIGQKIQNTFTKSKNIDQYITAYDRSYGIQKIFDLHMKKEYKQETLFIAAGILDRYIYLVGA